MTAAKNYRYIISRLLATLGVLALAGVLAWGSTSTTAARVDAQGAKGLAGTWRIQVTPLDCTTGAERPPFASMISFERGGTLVETAASPAFQPGQRGPGHGVWHYEGAGSYRAVFEAFILFTTAPNPPAPGFAQGIQRVTQTMQVDGDEFTADATADFFDVNGDPVSQLCTKATGTRMVLERE